MAGLCKEIRLGDFLRVEAAEWLARAAR